jgi:hypothetical protein
LPDGLTGAVWVVRRPGAKIQHFEPGDTVTIVVLPTGMAIIDDTSLLERPHRLSIVTASGHGIEEERGNGTGIHYREVAETGRGSVMFAIGASADVKRMSSFDGFMVEAGTLRKSCEFESTKQYLFRKVGNNYVLSRIAD